MPERSEYQSGMPSWTSLTVPDVGAATKFYGDLFGWGHEDAEPAEETGGYGFFMQDGKMVGGVNPSQEEGPAAGQPAAWTMYVSTDDADATTAKVKENGGSAMMEPMDVMEEGRMAVLADPVGAVFGIWQAGKHKGAELISEPVAFTWAQLNTREPQKAAPFYETVFNWRQDPDAPATGAEYTTWKLGEELGAGMMEMDSEMPAEVPSHWLAWFAVKDADATAAKAEELGGAISAPPFDIDGVGRGAVLADPSGATFGVIKLDNPPG